MLAILKTASQGLELIAGVLFILAILGMMRPKFTLRFWKLRSRKTLVPFYMILALLAGGLGQSAFEASLTPEERAELEEIARVEEEERQRKETDRRAEQIAELVDEARAIPADDYVENLDVYKKLLKLSPDDEKFQSKVAHYQDALDRQREEEHQASEAKRIERQRLVAEQQAELDRREAKFGPKPYQSDMTYKVVIVEHYLKATAKDPGSVKCERWWPMQYSKKEGWVVRCDWRAKNSFGGYVREINTFIIQHGRVVSVR